MKHTPYHLLFVGMLLIAGMLGACSSDEITDDSYYTFTGETVASYCSSRPETFSIFSRIVEEAELKALLSTYGHYTAFIPTDSAFNVYFRESGVSLDTMSSASKADIVYNHIIRSTSIEYTTNDFSQGALSTPNMNNRYMVISYGESSEDSEHPEIFVNKSARIVNEDVELHNGIVHVLDRVLVPSDETLGTLLSTLADESIFAEAFRLTHLDDSIAESYDMSFTSPYSTEYVTILGYSMKPVQQKKLGYTIFAESNEVMASAGIKSVDDLVSYAENYYGTEDCGDYTSRRNALNRFISYHMLDRMMSTNAFVYSGPQTVATAMGQRYEYYETMLENRLMEIKAGNCINQLSDGTYVGIDESNSNVSGMNGYVHVLSNMLVYDENNMVSDVLNKRLRFDAYSIPPELTNNNVRWQLTELDGYGMTVAPNFCGKHFWFNDDTKFIMWASNGWNDYQADEMSLRGWYDFTFRLPPMPPGTYEIRLGYSVREWGGIAQLFIDGQIVGIPVDFKTTGDNPTIGWVKDSETKDNGEENDKAMRNRGYMKGPASVINSIYANILRDDASCLRKIIGTYTWQEYGAHYFRAKNVETEDGEFHLDYFEIVPTSYIEQEDKN